MDIPSESAMPLRFASDLLPSPPNAPPPIPGERLDAESAVQLFSHAVLLFHAYTWHASIKYHRSILRRDASSQLLPASQLWFNIGVIRGHLGEYALAVEAFDRAVAADGELAVAWFAMGIALFQLGDYRRAERRFKVCLTCIGGPDVVAVNYEAVGLRWVLVREQVEFNVRLCLAWKLHMQLKAEKPSPCALHRIPAGLVFNPDEWRNHRPPPGRDDAPRPNVKSGSASPVKKWALAKTPTLLRRMLQKARGPSAADNRSGGGRRRDGKSDDHRRNESAAASTTGAFKPLPPLPLPLPLPLPSPRATSIAARRQSAYARLVEPEVEHPRPAVVRPPATRASTQPRPGAGPAPEIRDTLEIFAMGVLQPSDEETNDPS
ncbi:MAG: hypothetical protein M1826_006237 [Phylliscum demangeonii]|nr:MAG: hypothetical protein M1826_006237 [Phylliscum demangeonii]